MMNSITIAKVNNVIVKFLGNSVSHDYARFLTYFPVRWYIMDTLNSKELFPVGYKGTSRDIINVLKENSSNIMSIQIAMLVASNFDNSVREALQCMSNGKCKEFSYRKITKYPPNCLNGKTTRSRVTYTFH